MRAQNINLICSFTQGNPLTTIVRPARAPDIHISVRDIRELISHNSPKYHELIILILEAICSTFNSHYIDPSLFTTLRSHN